MTRGIYISQKTSRQLGVKPGEGHPDLLFDARASMSGEHLDHIAGNSTAKTAVAATVHAEKAAAEKKATLHATGPKYFKAHITLNAHAAVCALISCTCRRCVWCGKDVGPLSAT
jgi:hypothetical protein